MDEWVLSMIMLAGRLSCGLSVGLLVFGSAAGRESIWCPTTGSVITFPRNQ
jgi:hypothetical protein